MTPKCHVVLSVCLVFFLGGGGAALEGVGDVAVLAGAASDGGWAGAA